MLNNDSLEAILQSTGALDLVLLNTWDGIRYLEVPGRPITWLGGNSAVGKLFAFDIEGRLVTPIC